MAEARADVAMNRPCSGWKSRQLGPRVSSRSEDGHVGKIPITATSVELRPRGVPQQAPSLADGAERDPTGGVVLGRRELPVGLASNRVPDTIYASGRSRTSRMACSTLAMRTVEM